MQIDFLKDLNDIQQQAVQATEGPVIILAGAGSGKTRALTYRIAYLLKNNINPFNILALTFTNKAAKEMMERIGTLINSTDAMSVNMGTFHSVFARILRKEGFRLGYKSSFTIYDEEDSKNLIKTIIKEKGLDDKKYKPSYIQHRISNVKNNLISPAAYLNDSDLMNFDRNCQLQELVNIYTIYNTRCFNSQAMDFDDLLFNMYLLLDGYAEVLLKYQHRFTYILVDEYQDTNRVQYMILKKLAAARRNICVVGDDAQSIYSFRGANIENILNFQKDYPDAQTFKMEQNYRSTKNIVNAANSVIHKNKRQIYKQVWTENESGVKINIIKAQSDSDEASSIANSIFETKMNHQLPNSDFAILYRTNAQSRALEDALRKLNIPYRIFGAISFYRRKEIKDLLAYFRLVINQDDDQSLLRIINYPARGIGKTTIDKLTEVAAQRNLSLWKAIYSDNNGLTPNTINKIKDFCILIMNFVKQLGDIDAYTLARNIAIGTGLTRELSEDKTPEGISKYENIEELLNAINEFTEDNAEIPDEEGNFDLPTLDKYMENIALLTDADKNDKDDINRVSLMTVHAAKGLEFKYVYITGLEEKLFPSGMSIDTPQGVEEERRLFYVAITRAKVKVTLSHCRHRYRWGEFTFCNPSRFLSEIDPQFLDIVEKDIVQEESFYSSKPILNTNIKLKSLKELSENKVVDNENIDDKIQTGMEVEHIRFGKGKILRLEGSGVNRKATVFFHDHGNKQLILKFAKLKIIKD